MELGRGDPEIARLTGIPQSTISGWRHGRGVVYHEKLGAATRGWRPKAEGSYCYLLGTYLGDGCIQLLASGAAVMVITLDSKYPGVVAEVERSLRTVFPQTPVARFLRTAGSVTALKVSHPALPFAFPQHGAGYKHTRSIVLCDWQRELTARYPEQLVRGLIHSDGCRTINRFTTTLPSGRVAEYEYPRYFFSNLSGDIRRIFCDHCELLGIRWTQSNHRNISIAHRNDVAVLDRLVGRKS